MSSSLSLCTFSFSRVSSKNTRDKEWQFMSHFSFPKGVFYVIFIESSVHTLSSCIYLFRRVLSKNTRLPVWQIMSHFSFSRGLSMSSLLKSLSTHYPSAHFDLPESPLRTQGFQHDRL